MKVGKSDQSSSSKGSASVLVELLLNTLNLILLHDGAAIAKKD